MGSVKELEQTFIRGIYSINVQVLTIISIKISLVHEFRVNAAVEMTLINLYIFNCILLSRCLNYSFLASMSVSFGGEGVSGHFLCVLKQPVSDCLECCY